MPPARFDERWREIDVGERAAGRRGGRRPVAELTNWRGGPDGARRGAVGGVLGSRGRRRGRAGRGRRAVARRGSRGCIRVAVAHLTAPIRCTSGRRPTRAPGVRARRAARLLATARSRTEFAHGALPRSRGARGRWPSPSGKLPRCRRRSRPPPAAGATYELSPAAGAVVAPGGVAVAGVVAAAGAVVAAGAVAVAGVVTAARAVVALVRSPSPVLLPPPVRRRPRVVAVAWVVVLLHEPRRLHRPCAARSGRRRRRRRRRREGERGAEAAEGEDGGECEHCESSDGHRYLLVDGCVCILAAGTGRSAGPGGPRRGARARRPARPAVGRSAGRGRGSP